MATKYLSYDGVSTLWSKTKSHVSTQIASVTNQKGAANGIATLDANKRIPLSQLGNLDTDVFVVVTALPTTNIKTNKIYILKDSTTSGDLYQEYYYTNNAWEKLGTHQLQIDWTTLNNHIANKSNPHGVTKAQVGLGSVDNTSDANKPVSTAQATAIADAKAAGTTAQTNLTTHTNNKSNPHGVTKAQVGLGNVDNTSDANKPISTATQTALNKKADVSALSNYLPLKGGGLVYENTSDSNYNSINIAPDSITFQPADGDNMIIKTGSIETDGNFSIQADTSITSADGVVSIGIDLDGLSVSKTTFDSSNNPTNTTTTTFVPKSTTGDITLNLPTTGGTLALQSAVDTKVDKVSGKQLSTNDYTTAEKNKLAGIPSDANHTTVDSALNNTSTNPVQNKAVYSAISAKVNTSDFNTYKTSVTSSLASKLNTSDITAITTTELEALLV